MQVLFPLLQCRLTAVPLLKFSTKCQRKKDAQEVEGRPREKASSTTQPPVSLRMGLWDRWGSLLVTAGGQAWHPLRARGVAWTAAA